VVTVACPTSSRKQKARNDRDVPPTNAAYGRSQISVAFLLLLIAALAVATPAFAGNKGKKAHSAPPEPTRMSQTTVALIIVTERTIIFDYVKQYRRLLCPLQGTLSPYRRESRRRLRVAARYLQASPSGNLPNHLLTQLPARPGYQWVVVDNDVVLIAATTSLPWQIVSGRERSPVSGATSTDTAASSLSAVPAARF
jgi:hypothetical protein